MSILTLKMEISGICYDSRTMRPGELFVAAESTTDGHRFIREALERGASCVVCEHPPEREGPWITVPDARAALAALSANWFGHPAREVTVLGVTGTNGKTTTTYLLKAMLEEVPGGQGGAHRHQPEYDRRGEPAGPAHHTGDLRGAESFCGRWRTRDAAMW